MGSRIIVRVSIRNVKLRPRHSLESPFGNSSSENDGSSDIYSLTSNWGRSVTLQPYTTLNVPLVSCVSYVSICRSNVKGKTDATFTCRTSRYFICYNKSYCCCICVFIFKRSRAEFCHMIWGTIGRYPIWRPAAL